MAIYGGLVSLKSELNNLELKLKKAQEKNLAESSINKFKSTLTEILKKATYKISKVEESIQNGDTSLFIKKYELDLI